MKRSNSRRGCDVEVEKSGAADLGAENSGFEDAATAGNRGRMLGLGGEAPGLRYFERLHYREVRCYWGHQSCEAAQVVAEHRNRAHLVLDGPGGR